MDAKNKAETLERLQELEDTVNRTLKLVSLPHRCNKQCICHSINLLADITFMEISIMRKNLNEQGVTDANPSNEKV